MFSTSVYNGMSNKIIKFLVEIKINFLHRENEEEFNTPKAFPMTERVKSPKSFLEAGSVPSPPVPVPLNEEKEDATAAAVTPPIIVQPPVVEREEENVHEVDYIHDLEERPCSVLSEDSERKLVEEEIAAVLSGESEVLKEHNTLGFVFY